MSTETLSLTDSIYIKRTPSASGPRAGQNHRQLLVYFIPGNPGLIEYYYDFLTHLAQLLDPDATNFVYHVVGHSLGGFELQGGVTGVAQLESMLNGTAPRRNASKDHVLGLEEQQLFVCESLRATIHLINSHRPGNVEKEQLPVVLVGHSVGAYLLMGAIDLRQRTLIAREEDTPLPNEELLQHVWKQYEMGDLPEETHNEFQIVGGVALFPTIVDLARSPRGRKVAPLAKRWWFPYVLHYIAYILRLLPAFVVRRLVKVITGMPWEAADVTTSFLRSTRGIFQALYMARDELLQMTHDKWRAIVWNRNLPEDESVIESIELDRPQLYFFWGENDYWIDNKTRDKIIAEHARTTGLSAADDEGRPYMKIDQTGIPHDFCIRPEHSERVAAKVHGFVRDAI